MYDLTMITEEIPLTKAERRAMKKRPRMKVSGASLKFGSKHAGLKLAKQKSRKK